LLKHEQVLVGALVEGLFFFVESFFFKKHCLLIEKELKYEQLIDFFLCVFYKGILIESK